MTESPSAPLHVVAVPPSLHCPGGHFWQPIAPGEGRTDPAGQLMQVPLTGSHAVHPPPSVQFSQPVPLSRAVATQPVQWESIGSHAVHPPPSGHRSQVSAEPPEDHVPAPQSIHEALEIWQPAGHDVQSPVIELHELQPPPSVHGVQPAEEPPGDHVPLGTTCTQSRSGLFQLGSWCSDQLPCHTQCTPLQVSNSRTCSRW